jgi:hypothetical protein
MNLNELPVEKYQLDFWQGVIHVAIERCHQRDGSSLWAIRENGCCLSKDGEWEIEDMPSTRDIEFASRCRWATAQDALDFWNRGHKSRFSHYREQKEQTE